MTVSLQMFKGKNAEMVNLKGILHFRHVNLSLPAALRSISAMPLARSLVLAGTCSPSLVMSGTAFLRPVRSQLMKSEYDASTSIICP